MYSFLNIFSKLYYIMVAVYDLCFLIPFLIGIITVIITNPLPHYIIKTPTLYDTYTDDNNNNYKYELKYIS